MYVYVIYFDLIIWLTVVFGLSMLFTLCQMLAFA